MGIGPLVVGEAALPESIPVHVEEMTNAVYVGEIDAETDDPHSDPVVIRR
jgi:hypothetical protein